MKADYGETLGFGYDTSLDAISTIDWDDPPLGQTFKISGGYYVLSFDTKKYYFRLMTQQEVDNES